MNVAQRGKKRAGLIQDMTPPAGTGNTWRVPPAGDAQLGVALNHHHRLENNVLLPESETPAPAQGRGSPVRACIDSDAARATPSSDPRVPDTDSITRLVHGFYGDVRADPLLGPVFEHALGDGDWSPHLERMVDFWSTVMLGSRRFRGNVFDKHLRLQDVTPAHFSAWMRLWSLRTERLFDAGVARELQLVAHGIGRNLFRGLFGRLPAFEQERAQAHAASHR